MAVSISTTDAVSKQIVLIYPRNSGHAYVADKFMGVQDWIGKHDAAVSLIQYEGKWSVNDFIAEGIIARDVQDAETIADGLKQIDEQAGYMERITDGMDVHQPVHWAARLLMPRVARRPNNRRILQELSDPSRVTTRGDLSNVHQRYDDLGPNAVNRYIFVFVDQPPKNMADPYNLLARDYDRYKVALHSPFQTPAGNCTMISSTNRILCSSEMVRVPMITAEESIYVASVPSLETIKSTRMLEEQYNMKLVWVLLDSQTNSVASAKRGAKLLERAVDDDTTVDDDATYTDQSEWEVSNFQSYDDSEPVTTGVSDERGESELLCAKLGIPDNMIECMKKVYCEYHTIPDMRTGLREIDPTACLVLNENTGLADLLDTGVLYGWSTTPPVLVGSDLIAQMDGNVPIIPQSETLGLPVNLGSGIALPLVLGLTIGPIIGLILVLLAIRSWQLLRSSSSETEEYPASFTTEVWSPKEVVERENIVDLDVELFN